MAFEAAVPDATPLVVALLEGPAEPDPVAMTDMDGLEMTRLAGMDVVEVALERVAVTLAVRVSVSAFLYYDPAARSRSYHVQSEPDGVDCGLLLCRGNGEMSVEESY